MNEEDGQIGVQFAVSECLFQLQPTLWTIILCLVRLTTIGVSGTCAEYNDANSHDLMLYDEGLHEIQNVHA